MFRGTSFCSASGLRTGVREPMGCVISELHSEYESLFRHLLKSMRRLFNA